jgi:hypothetical protein
MFVQLSEQLVLARNLSLEKDRRHNMARISRVEINSIVQSTTNVTLNAGHEPSRDIARDTAAWLVVGRSNCLARIFHLKRPSFSKDPTARRSPPLHQNWPNPHVGVVLSRVNKNWLCRRTDDGGVFG